MMEAVMDSKPAALEAHYSVAEIARMWHMGRESVRLLMRDEPGVLRIRRGRKQVRSTYSIPESVALRVHARLQNG
jgi:hypothetical protein